MKKIVFCADGTWDGPIITDEKILETNSNVYKLYSLLKHLPGQLPIYEPGVGYGEWIGAHILDGMLGNDIFFKIKQGYAQIANIYQPGDVLYFFGFSRGAYTVRSLAGMIAKCGLPGPKKFSYSSIEDAFQAYQKLDSSLSDPFRKNYAVTDPEIKMIGVWDTVGALGGPDQSLDENTFGFLDTALHKNIKSAYHALSIDEKRSEFRPTLWRQDQVLPTQTLEQVWFSGVHTDVGGGYAEHGLSDITLEWMIKNATVEGLIFEDFPDSISMYREKSALDKLHTSWAPKFGDPAERILPSGSKVSSTVKTRLESLSDYMPSNLNDFLKASENFTFTDLFSSITEN